LWFIQLSSCIGVQTGNKIKKPPHLCNETAVYVSILA
jgi:hypothetical protein